MLEDCKTTPPGPLSIGNRVIDTPLVLAPMAGVTDGAYRFIMACHGVGLVTTEMVSAEGLRRHQPATLKLCRQHPAISVPMAVQLFGADPAVMAEGARCAASLGADFIDINAGCPVRKIVRQGAGACLLKEPERLEWIVDSVKSAVDVPVTVKIRIGWDAANSSVVSLAQRLAAAGADAISIHARTAVQQYGGRADWNWIRAVKEAVAIPVLGNGDVTSASLAQRMLRSTGCDGVMIGRGTMGNPWLLSTIVHEWGCANGTMEPAGWDSFRDTVHLHVDLLGQERKRPPGHFRKLFFWYSKGCPDSSRFRAGLYRLEQVTEMTRAFDEWILEVQSRGVLFESRKLGDSLQTDLQGEDGIE